MKKRAEELRPKLLPQSTLGQAVNYFLNDYEALKGYLKDGRFEIDNNLVENDIRPAAVGRKRWLFIGHPSAGWRSAVMYSVLGSCRRRGLNPYEYLTDVLARLPSTKITEIHSLLPTGSALAHPSQKLPSGSELDGNGSSAHTRCPRASAQLAKGEVRAIDAPRLPLTFQIHSPRGCNELCRSSNG